MEFGEKIKKLREDKGLSQKLVAEKIGISDVSLGRYERGAVKAPQNEAIYEKLAKTLGCSKEYLKGETDEIAAAATVKKDKAKAAKAGKSGDAAKAAETGKKAKADKNSGRAKASKTDKAPASGEIAVNIELQYGDMSVTYEELMRRAREAAGGAAQTISLYVKPEEGRAYYVAGDESGSFAL